jgi:hypothetical protein
MLFACAVSTLKDFGLNHKHLGADMGMTAVLHTQSRRLDYHPHLHVIVPGGGIDPGRRQWKKVKSKYLFPEKNLAKVFRARLLAALSQAGFRVPAGAPDQWVVDCAHVGRGLPALQYLSRDLSRCVIAEKNFLSCQDKQVNFR